MTALFVRLLLCAALFTGVSALGVEARQTAETVKVSRYSAVHGRQGPKLDHQIMWRYEREGLPMLVVRETHGWRRVRDPDGDEVWMQARMLSAQRTALITVETELKRDPDVAARSKARLKPGVIAELVACEQGWCKVEIERKSGYLPQSALWGTEIETGNL